MPCEMSRVKDFGSVSSSVFADSVAELVYNGVNLPSPSPRPRLDGSCHSIVGEEGAARPLSATSEQVVYSFPVYGGVH